MNRSKRIVIGTILLLLFYITLQEYFFSFSDFRNAMVPMNKINNSERLHTACKLVEEG